MKTCSSDRSEEIRALVDSASFDDATDVALQHYGSELYNYVWNILLDHRLAAEAFRACAVCLWKGWRTFDGSGRVDLWMYSTARRATFGVWRAESGRRPQEEPDQDEVGGGLRELVVEFEPEERELLTLRIGHRMSWCEIAQVVEAWELEGRSLERAVKRLRGRYLRLKRRLREGRRRMRNDAR